MIHTISELVEKAVKNNNATLAVAAAHDRDVLEAVIDARRESISDSILIGNESEIRRILYELGEDPQLYSIIDSTNDKESAFKAVACISNGSANILMKGKLNTPDLMKAVVSKSTGITNGRLLSSIMFFEIPGYPKLLMDTDGGVNPQPNLEKKTFILENAAIVLKKLGYETINCACISGSEIIDPKIQSTVDAQVISSMKDRWAQYNMNVFGPVGFDLAISKKSCKIKRYSEPGCGEADILLVPNYETGNSIGKTLLYFTDSKNAGVVTDTKTPIVLVSRADNAESKHASIALAVSILS